MSVSVLMSVYYKEKPEFLNEALDSIWDQQTLKPNEIILVQDGPLPENLLSVIDLWKKKTNGRLITISLSQNMGLTYALNKGIPLCTGDYIARMDSDDLSTPYRFEKQSNFLDHNPLIHVVGGSVQVFTEKDLCKNILRYPLSSDMVPKYITKYTPISHPGSMFRKSVFDDGIRYCEKFKTCQDIELWFNMLSQGYKISNIEEVVLKSRDYDALYYRRSKNRAKVEFIIFWEGIKKIHGITWRLIFPIIRYILRRMPVFVIKIGYSKYVRGILKSRA